MYTGVVNVGPEPVHVLLARVGTLQGRGRSRCGGAAACMQAAGRAGGRGAVSGYVPQVPEVLGYKANGRRPPTAREPARTRAHQPCRLEGQTPALPPRESAACRRARTGRYTPVVVTFRKLERFLFCKEEKPTSRALRVAPSGAAFDATVLVFFGSAARARGAARRRAGCRPRGAEAFVTASHAAVAMLGRLALARCPVLARCPIQALNACSTASSVPWSSRVAKVPGRDPFGTATQGRGRVLAGGCALSGPPASSASESSRGAFRVYISM